MQREREGARVKFSELTTGSGANCAEVASALQKSIRRGLEREALHWSSELDQAGFGNYSVLLAFQLRGLRAAPHSGRRAGR
jgi:hypothetical protein